MGPQERRVLAGFGWGVAGAIAMGVLQVLTRLVTFGTIAHVVPIQFTERFLLDFTPWSPTAGTILIIGTSLHLVYGGFWGAFAASMAEPMTPLRGMLLGILLWVLAAMVVMPYLGMGLFGTEGAQEVTLATLVAHLVYGVTYGTLLDPGFTVRQSRRHKVGVTA